MRRILCSYWTISSKSFGTAIITGRVGRCYNYIFHTKLLSQQIFEKNAWFFHFGFTLNSVNRENHLGLHECCQHRSCLLDWFRYQLLQLDSNCNWINWISHYTTFALIQLGHRLTSIMLIFLREKGCGFLHVKISPSKIMKKLCL